MAVLDDVVVKHLRKCESYEDALALWEEIWTRASTEGVAAAGDYLEALLEPTDDEEVDAGTLDVENELEASEVE